VQVIAAPVLLSNKSSCESGQLKMQTLGMSLVSVNAYDGKSRWKSWDRSLRPGKPEGVRLPLCASDTLVSWSFDVCSDDGVPQMKPFQSCPPVTSAILPFVLAKYATTANPSQKRISRSAKSTSLGFLLAWFCSESAIRYTKSTAY